MEELIDEIISYHFKHLEHKLAEGIIKKDKKFAEALYLELQMQLMFSDDQEKLDIGE
jgi:hypothetical protein